LKAKLFWNQEITFKAQGLKPNQALSSYGWVNWMQLVRYEQLGVKERESGVIYTGF
jgi:hypothetical protein